MVNTKNLCAHDILHSSEIEYYFPYSDEGKTRHYHPDFFLPNENRVIEVKSVYTLCSSKKLWNQFNAKRKSVLKAGNRFSLLLLTKKGERIIVPEILLDKPYSSILRFLRKIND